MTTLEEKPAVRHAGDADIPWVDVGGGIELKVLRVNARAGQWVVANRFAPGVRLQTHRHTGPVDGYTIAGRWHYLEYDFYSTAGSYIREPAGSVHTLDVPADNDGVTEVVFMMEGVNLDLRPDGTVENVVDGTGTLEFYLAMCEELGLGRPPVVIE